MNLFRLFVFASAFFAVLAASSPMRAVELTVAAASDLKFALDDLAGEFTAAQPNINVKITYGASGNFFAQLQNRAPFDLYFSADVDYPRKLAAAGLALDGDVFVYAVGHLVVWVPAGSSVDIEKTGAAGLLDPTIRKVAVANPQHAPYGRAAVAALKSLGLYAQLEPKLVLGENIAQTAQFVESGAADAGVLALSLALAPKMKGKGRWWEVPLEAYPRMEQGGMILKATKQPEAARAFRDFVRGEHGRAVLARYGFYFTPAN